jgi:hypothetical protein
LTQPGHTVLYARRQRFGRSSEAVISVATTK